MTIEETPYVSIDDMNTNAINGNGAFIPVIIGQTNNTVSADNLQIQTFTSFEHAYSDNGGIGTDLTANKSLSFLKRFLDECTPLTRGDIGLPKFYFIDMGNIPFSNGDAWSNAFELAKTKKDAKCEIIVGFKKEDASQAITDEELATFVGILESANTSIINTAKIGNRRQLYFTIEDATDEDMIKITSTTSTRNIQKSRILPMEPAMFPEICARYCVTPYYVEPGFIKFRTISADDVDERSRAMEKKLQNAGINFIRKEMVTEGEIARICKGVSSANALANKPDDVLPHCLRNSDNLLERVHLKCSDTLKDNETSYAVDMLQTDIDDIIDDEITLRRMQYGTELTVSEVGANPYYIKISGKTKPINSIYYINIEHYIEVPGA